MSLRDIAEADLGRIMENTSEFGRAVVLTSPDGVSAQLVGFNNDVSAAIDPDTGQIVSSRRISFSFRLSSLAGLGIPYSVAANTPPWKVQIEGETQIYRVSQTLPDRRLGIVVVIAELFK